MGCRGGTGAGRRRGRNGALTGLRQARELAESGGSAGDRVDRVIDEILARPEHAWFEEGASAQMEEIRRHMEERYGQGGGQSSNSATGH